MQRVNSLTAGFRKRGIFDRFIRDPLLLHRIKPLSDDKRASVTLRRDLHVPIRFLLPLLDRLMTSLLRSRRVRKKLRPTRG